jgi:hypothetical protein
VVREEQGKIGDYRGQKGEIGRARVERVRIGNGRGRVDRGVSGKEGEERWDRGVRYDTGAKMDERK